MSKGKFLSGGTCLFYNVINPADRSQARWLSPCAKFYYCHACTLRMVEGIGTWDKHDNICANGNFLNWLLISFFKESSWTDKCYNVFVTETNWREQQPFEIQVKLPWLKFPEPHGQNILHKPAGGVPSLQQGQATIPAVFAAAGTSLRGASSNINSPCPRLAAMPRTRSKQASSSEEEGFPQDDDNDDISWNRKQPAKRRK